MNKTMTRWIGVAAAAVSLAGCCLAVGHYSSKWWWTPSKSATTWPVLSAKTTTKSTVVLGTTTFMPRALAPNGNGIMRVKYSLDTQNGCFFAVLDLDGMAKHPDVTGGLLLGATDVAKKALQDSKTRNDVFLWARGCDGKAKESSDYTFYVPGNNQGYLALLFADKNTTASMTIVTDDICDKSNIACLSR